MTGQRALHAGEIRVLLGLPRRGRGVGSGASLRPLRGLQDQNIVRLYRTLENGRVVYSVKLTVFGRWVQSAVRLARMQAVGDMVR